MWEVIVVGLLVTFICGIAIWAMKKSKSEFNTFATQAIDIELLVQKLKEELLPEIKLLLEQLLKQRKYETYDNPTRSSTVAMDESIIPVNVSVNAEAVNINSATTEQQVVDKDLDRSKSKLANLLKTK